MSIFRLLESVRDHGTKWVIQALYSCVKPWVRVDPKKILFLSRHSNQETLDFLRLREALEAQDPEVRVTLIARRFEGEVTGIPAFAWTVVRSLFHLASANVCVLDSYWPGVSLVNHHSNMRVYQMWHSLGKVKRTGKQAVGQTQGRMTGVASALKMHDGYDYVVAGGTYWNRDYCETFGVEEDQVLHFGLPRADDLVQRRDETAERIYEKYPELRLRPVVLYAPTFRRGVKPKSGAMELATRIDSARYALVVKPHQEDRIDIPKSESVFTCPDFSGFELLSIADYLVTDYSSIALEAALIDIPTFYYLYDYVEYIGENGVNIDLLSEMSSCAYVSAEELGRALEEPYPVEALQEYKGKYLFENPGRSAEKLAAHILSQEMR